MVKARSMLSRMMKSRRVATRISTIRGRTLEASHGIGLPPGSDLMLQLMALGNHHLQLLLVLRAQLIILVQDALEHTQASPIWEKISNSIKKVGCFAMKPGAQGCLPDGLL